LRENCENYRPAQLAIEPAELGVDLRFPARRRTNHKKMYFLSEEELAWGAELFAHCEQQSLGV
jgi:predicted transcriptional regulator